MPNVTPDGARYLQMGKGERAPFPFQLRWLVPWFCKTDSVPWARMAVGSLLVSTLAVGVLAGLRLDTWWAVPAAMALWASLPMTLFNIRHPVLVDLPGQAVAASTAVATLLITNDAAPGPAMLVLAVVLSLLAGATRETAPVWAAVWAWNPLPLIGLVVPLLTKLLVKPGLDVPQLREPLAITLEHPFRASRQAHLGLWLDPRLMVAPWGALLVGLYAPTWQVAVALVLGYAQVLAATDTVRLYQWAAPVLIVASLTVVPLPFWLPLVVVGVFWPWKGGGV